MLGSVGLKEVIPHPAVRPSSWLSTAYHKDDNNPDAELCSAEYQVNHAAPNTVAYIEQTAARLSQKPDTIKHSCLQTTGLEYTGPNIQQLGLGRAKSDEGSTAFIDHASMLLLKAHPCRA